jgi:hypothetical protein
MPERQPDTRHRIPLYKALAAWGVRRIVRGMANETRRRLYNRRDNPRNRAVKDEIHEGQKEYEKKNTENHNAPLPDKNISLRAGLSSIIRRTQW